MPEQCFLRWRRKYGNIFTIWFGEQPQVCVAEFNKIIETFQKDGEAYSGRFTFEEFDKLVRGGTYGIIMTEGEFWRGQRRFALQIFRDFGLGKNLMQDKILSELELLFERIEEEIKQGKDVDFGENIDINLIMKRLGEFRQLKKLMDIILDTGFHPSVVLIRLWPSLRHLPFINSYFEYMKGVDQQLFDFHKKQIKEHLNSINSPPTDFVEAFLLEKQQKDLIGVPHDFTIEQLVGVANDLWFAGQETTSTTLNWGIAFLINNPNVQNKVHAELDSIIGDFDRIITTADRPSLPYLNALINVKQCLGEALARMELFLFLGNLLNKYKFMPGNDGIPSLKRFNGGTARCKKFKCRIIKREE
uniref:Unspecific monooxygenase n=1 Tax=Meloidogyne floridensis TaxID=298350 RepID=A0A915P1M9_9BILA